ncbi:DedA family protein [Micrococcoides hystricis]|uniref:DedA family protein n=1 Tax=Micrococcoides hystricis TaxID=1572761 RepID=A0ABV6PD02_9MICC
MDTNLVAEWAADLAWLYYPLTFILVAADTFLPPIPSEVLVAAGGILAREGSFSLWGIITVATVGGFVGDLGLYAMTRYRIRHWLVRQRWGRWLYDRIGRVMTKVGPTTSYTGMIVFRIVAGGRTAVVATAGMMGIPWRPFLITTTLGSILWGIYMPLLGYFAHEMTGWPLWASAVLAMVVGTLLGLLVAWLIALGRRGKRGSRAGDVPGGTDRAG